eukprot:771222-Amphidinium_carterae.3
MGPTCTPFGGWSRLNQIRNPKGWSRAFDNAAPHGARCGEVAGAAGQQWDGNRGVACEPPARSCRKLLHLPMAPSAVTQRYKDTSMVTFDQCILGQVVNNVPATKPTTLVSNSPEILYQFEGLRTTTCAFPSASTGSASASACDRLPPLPPSADHPSPEPKLNSMPAVLEQYACSACPGWQPREISEGVVCQRSWRRKNMWLSP